MPETSSLNLEALRDAQNYLCYAVDFRMFYPGADPDPALALKDVLDETLEEIEPTDGQPELYRLAHDALQNRLNPPEFDRTWAMMQAGIPSKVLAGRELRHNEYPDTKVATLSRLRTPLTLGELGVGGVADVIALEPVLANGETGSDKKAYPNEVRGE